MKRRMLILAAVLAAAAVAIAAGMAASTGGFSGAQANLTKYKAVPKFVAPGPAFNARQRAGGKRSSKGMRG